MFLRGRSGTGVSAFSPAARVSRVRVSAYLARSIGRVILAQTEIFHIVVICWRTRDCMGSRNGPRSGLEHPDGDGSPWWLLECSRG